MAPLTGMTFCGRNDASKIPDQASSAGVHSCYPFGSISEGNCLKDVVVEEIPRLLSPGKSRRAEQTRSHVVYIIFPLWDTLILLCESATQLATRRKDKSILKKKIKEKNSN